MNSNIPYSQHHHSSQLLEKYNKIRFAWGWYLQLLISQRTEITRTITLSSQTLFVSSPRAQKKAEAGTEPGLQEVLMSPMMSLNVPQPPRDGSCTARGSTSSAQLCTHPCQAPFSPEEKPKVPHHPLPRHCCFFFLTLPFPYCWQVLHLRYRIKPTILSIYCLLIAWDDASRIRLALFLGLREFTAQKPKIPQDKPKNAEFFSLFQAKAVSSSLNVTVYSFIMYLFFLLWLCIFWPCAELHIIAKQNLFFPSPLQFSVGAGNLHKGLLLSPFRNPFKASSSFWRPLSEGLWGSLEGSRAS